MKKVLLLGVVLGAFALGSCSKTYTCDYGSGYTVTYNSDDYTKTQIDAARLACNSAGGDWSSE